MIFSFFDIQFLLIRNMFLSMYLFNSWWLMNKPEANAFAGGSSWWSAAVSSRVFVQTSVFSISYHGIRAAKIWTCSEEVHLDVNRAVATWVFRMELGYTVFRSNPIPDISLGAFRGRVSCCCVRWIAAGLPWRRSLRILIESLLGRRLIGKFG